MPTTYTSDKHRAIACRVTGTYCQGSLVVSNLPAHTNDDAIKSCPILGLQLGNVSCNSHVVKH